MKFTVNWGPCKLLAVLACVWQVGLKACSLCYTGWRLQHHDVAQQYVANHAMAGLLFVVQSPIQHSQLRKIDPEFIKTNLTAAGVDVATITKVRSLRWAFGCYPHGLYRT
jgi:hypothetical protein